jgi:hypothetical protein
VSKDLAPILAGWDYVPDEMSVRIVPGDDGRDKIQLRVDLGLMQLEFDDRPDGQRPGGFPSWLELYEHQQQAAAAAGEPFQLTSEGLSNLLREGVQYYHRYLSFWHLARYDLCARDTKRNLRLFGFVRAHALQERDKLQFDQWRPYVTMMHARSVATPLVESRRFTQALEAIDEGVAGIHVFLREYRQAHRANECQELQFLLGWRNEVERMRDGESPGLLEAIDRLQADLRSAIQREDFEEAARLRDEIRRRNG